MFTQQHEGLNLRIRQVRQEQFGARGVKELAQLLGISELAWLDFEAGSGVPAHILLDFIELTGVSALWLMCGEGSKFRPATTGHTENPEQQDDLPFVRLYYATN